MSSPEAHPFGCLYRARTGIISPSPEPNTRDKIQRVLVTPEEDRNRGGSRLSMGSKDFGGSERVGQNDQQGVVMVVMDLTSRTFTNAVSWALKHVVRKGDELRIVGILTHVLKPLGYKCRVDENSWMGANRKVLEKEVANKRCTLQNIPELQSLCHKAEVRLAIDVCVGLHPKNIVVDEARSSGAYHVVLDRTFKKDRKFFIDNLTCFVSRVRASGGVESIRSFALSKPKPLQNIGGLTPFNTQCSFEVAACPGMSKASSPGSSLRGSSVSSTTFNQDSKYHNGRLTTQDSIPSTFTSTSTSSLSFDAQFCDDLFSIDFSAAGGRNHTGLRYLETESGGLNNLNSFSELTSKSSDSSKNSPPSSLSWHGKGNSTQIGDSLKLSSSRPASSHPSQHIAPGVVALERVSNTMSGSPVEVGDVMRESTMPTSMDRRNSLSSLTSTSSQHIPSLRTSTDRDGTASTGFRHATTTKTVWVWTKSKDVMIASVEGGWSTLVFTPETKDLANEWTTIARINPVFLENGVFTDSEKKEVAVLAQVASGEQLELLPASTYKAGVVVMMALDWQMTSPGNMVAAFQRSSTALYATTSTARDAQTCFEGLDKGTDGVVLLTEDVSEVFALQAYLKEKNCSTTEISLVKAIVTQVESVGMGDRVCVDLCNLLNPGEGLLVGSFARALFLVHSECTEKSSMASRPFRVNAGPVHAYVGMADGRTAYLSDLHTGSQVMVVDALGHSRTVLVGRVKIESRPLLLVEVKVDGQRHSVLLQDTETVCLVAPGGERAAALPITSLKVGDALLLNLSDEVRYSGNQIQEFLVEK